MSEGRQTPLGGTKLRVKKDDREPTGDDLGLIICPHIDTPALNKMPDSEDVARDRFSSVPSTTSIDDGSVDDTTTSSHHPSQTVTTQDRPSKSIMAESPAIPVSEEITNPSIDTSAWATPPPTWKVLLRMKTTTSKSSTADILTTNATASGKAKAKLGTPSEAEPSRVSKKYGSYRIPLERLQFDQGKSTPFASGSFGEVWRATLLPDSENEAEHPGIPVAVKALKTGQTTCDRLERIFTREIMILTTVKHANIVEFFGYYLSIESNSACLITAWAPCGDIFTHLKTGDKQLSHKLTWIMNVTEGLKYLHSLGITHGDIKAQNIVLYDESTAQICDFGLAQLQDNPDFPAYEGSSRYAGSTRWCSPEFLMEGTRRPPQDVWAWAWLVWEILTGLIPYHNIFHEARVMFSILAGNALPDFKEHTELDSLPMLCKLLVSCWDREASERPSIDACLDIIKKLC